MLWFESRAVRNLNSIDLKGIFAIETPAEEPLPECRAVVGALCQEYLKGLCLDRESPDQSFTSSSSHRHSVCENRRLSLNSTIRSSTSTLVLPPCVRPRKDDVRGSHRRPRSAPNDSRLDSPVRMLAAPLLPSFIFTMPLHALFFCSAIHSPLKPLNCARARVVMFVPPCPHFHTAPFFGIGKQLNVSPPYAPAARDLEDNARQALARVVSSTYRRFGYWCVPLRYVTCLRLCAHVRVCLCVRRVDSHPYTLQSLLVSRLPLPPEPRWLVACDILSLLRMIRCRGLPIALPSLAAQPLGEFFRVTAVQFV
jgi:hypothetical protein